MGLTAGPSKVDALKNAYFFNNRIIGKNLVLWAFKARSNVQDYGFFFLKRRRSYVGSEAVGRRTAAAVSKAALY